MGPIDEPEFATDYHFPLFYSNFADIPVYSDPNLAPAIWELLFITGDPVFVPGKCVLFNAGD